MKTISLLFFYATVSLNLFCQYECERVLDSIYVYRWDEEDSIWVIGSRYTYSYDVIGYQTEEISYYWDSRINGWVKANRYVYTYDTNGNMTVLTNPI